MSGASSIARIQQAAVAAVLALAAAWFAWCWPGSPWLGLAGALVCLGAHVPFLVLEHILLRLTWRDDPTPRPTFPEHMLAIAREAIQGLRVFAWRQPFAWQSVRDELGPGNSARGIIFIHGFACNRGFWTPWMQRCHSQRIPSAAINLEPPEGPIERYIDCVDAAVQAMARSTGQTPVLVAHSMGGLVARAWMQATPHNPARVAHIITIGTPHRGTWLARFSQLPNGRQMRPGNTWLQALGGLPVGAAPSFTCWSSNTDNVVLPPSTATLPGADNRLVRGAGHVDLAFRPQVMEHTLALVRAL